MGLMTDGLKLVAGSSLRNMLDRLTRNRVSGVLTGAGITAVIQSSSVTTVLVVGFISAGLMSLRQSVPIIMGANIGTTVTAQILAFQVTKAALVLIAVGFAMEFALKKSRVKRLGSVLLGLGFIFLGMQIMGDATEPLRTYPPFLDLMQQMSNPLLGIAVAMVFTALVQSSSATIGIVIVLAGQGVISLESGIALILGANVGTCITGVLASIGKPREAVQAAGVHVLFNVAGVLLWGWLIGPLADLVCLISPASTAADPVARLAADTPRQVANAHTLFNLANTLVFIGFTGSMAALVRRIIPDKQVSVSDRAAPQYLDRMFMTTPDVALEHLRLELVHLGGLVLPMVRLAVPTAIQGSRRDLQQLAALDNDVDQLYGKIYEYIGGMSQQEMAAEHTRQLTELMEVLNALEALGDIVETNIVPLGIRRVEQNIALDPDAGQTFQALVDLVVQALADAITALQKHDTALAQEVADRKQRVNGTADQVFARISRSLSTLDRVPMRRVRIEMDLLEMLRSSYYFARRVAKTVTVLDGAPANR